MKKTRLKNINPSAKMSKVKVITTIEDVLVTGNGDVRVEYTGYVITFARAAALSLTKQLVALQPYLESLKPAKPNGTTLEEPTRKRGRPAKSELQSFRVTCLLSPLVRNYLESLIAKNRLAFIQAAVDYQLANPNSIAPEDASRVHKLSTRTVVRATVKNKSQFVSNAIAYYFDYLRQLDQLPAVDKKIIPVSNQ